MRYLDLDVWIGPRAGQTYPVRAGTTSYGQAAEDAALELDALAPTLSAVVEERADPPTLTALGIRLHSLLFRAGTGRLATLLNQCLGGARGSGDGLRIRLRIEPPEVAALPWEFLYSTDDDCFIATSIHTPVVRYLELLQPIRELGVKPPLAMLVVIPQSEGIDASAEEAVLAEALDHLGDAVVYKVITGDVTRARLREVLREREWQVLHYIGHGDFDGDRAVLILNGPAGAEDRMDHQALRLLLANHPTLKLVVLNSCLGAQVSPAKAFLGMAPQLVRAGIPAVVAMQYEIRDQEAVSFAREFYGCLFAGTTRGRVEIAMAHARSTLAADYPGRALGTPVLFMRAPEGVLFELVAGGLQDIPVAPARVETARAVQRTREHNVRALGLIGPAATESDASLLAQEQGELTRVRRLIRFRALAGAGAAVVALVLFAAAWLGLFNWLPWFLRPEAYAVWIGDRLSTPELDDRIVLVVADSLTENTVGRPWDSTWRAEHARLIERLSRAGAAVIAMDVVFQRDGDAAVDAQLGDAVQRARARGTDVVLAAEEWAGDRLNLLPRLASQATAAGVCVGKRPLQSATILPLATRRGAAEPIPSLALAAAMGLRRQKLLGLDQAARSLLLRDAAGEVRTHGFTEVERISGLQPGCRFLREDDVSANLLIEHTDLKVLRGTQHRLRYEEVVAEQEPDLGRVRGRAALVGRLFAGDRFRIWRGPLSVERRYGVELHADALNTVLRDVVIRPAGNAIQFAATLLLAVAGAAIAGLALGDWARRAALVVVAGLWLAVCAYVYAEDRILLIALIQLAALVSAHAIARRTKRWVFP